MSTAVAHRRALYGHNRNAAWQAYLEGDLPEGYRRVEYIESSAAQHIDTGFTPDYNTAIVSKWTINTGNGQFGLFGSFGNSWGDNSYGCNGSSALYDNFKADTSTGYSSSAVRGKTFVYKKIGRYTEITGQLSWTRTYNAVTFTCPQSMYLFAIHYGSNTVNHRASAKCYYFYIDDNGTRVRHYIPALRLSDNKPGLYDLCGSICPLTNSPFYVNSGTGADFLWKEFDGPHTDEVWYWAPEKVTLYSQTGVTEHTFKGGKGIVKFNTPVTTIGQTLRETVVTKIVLPSGTTGINASALYGCKELVSILLPPHLKTIGGSAFLACNSLALTELPAGLTSIGQAAFQSCSALEVSELPSGITTLPRDVFYACYSIHNFVFNDGVDTIGTYIFYGVSNLNTVLFRGTPSSINATALAGCRNLHNIYVPWSEGEVANAPWGATNATIHYNHTAS